MYIYMSNPHIPYMLIKPLYMRRYAYLLSNAELLVALFWWKPLVDRCALSFVIPVIRCHLLKSIIITYARGKGILEHTMFGNTLKTTVHKAI